MKGDEITTADMKRWEKEGRIPVVCRLCGEVVLYPSKFFRKDEFVNYECVNCKMLQTLFGR